MATIRAKLTVAYAGALLSSVAVLSVALSAARRSSARREAPREVALQADQAIRVLKFAVTANEQVTVVRDPLVGAQLTARVASILDGLPDYVILLDQDGWRIYVSPSVRRLQERDTVASRSARERGVSDYERLVGEAKALPPGTLTFPIQVANTDVMLVSLAETDPTTAVTRVVVGRPVDLTAGWLREFIVTLLVVAPLIIGASVGGEYVIAGKAV